MAVNRFVHSSALFLCTFFPYFTLVTFFLLHFFSRCDSLCYTLFVLQFGQVALFTCCIFFMLHSLSYRNFPVLHSLHVAHFLCCTNFMLHFFRVALFSCCTFFRDTIFSSYTFFVLHFSRGALFSRCIFFVFFFSVLLHVAFCSCCTLFVLHSFRVAFFLVEFF